MGSDGLVVFAKGFLDLGFYAMVWLGLWPVVVATNLSLERESGVLAMRIKGTTKLLLLWVSWIGTK